MNRLYDATSYLEKISTVIVKNPNIAIGTDVIVGFPGESDLAFLNTRDLIEEIPFSYLHIFPFSSRPGTAASRMIDQIEFAVRKKRHNVLNLLNNKKKTAYRSSQINKTLEIVLEDEDPDQGMVGTSSNYLKIRVHSKEYPRKSLITVSIAGRAGDALIGVPVEKL
jgi:threonylcarbamoyladenosine tRNA methylthiotransferase MtaB